tara:strand:- start:648 stop:1157 length:510 start_codon:yes stop_codon:yes gene_type:complete
MATNLEFIKTESGIGVTTLTVADCFSSAYDVYFMSISKAKFSSNAYTQIRFMDSSGTVINQTEYDYASLDMYANTGYANLYGTGQSSIPNFGLAQSGVSDFGGISTFIFNPYQSDTYTSVKTISSSFSSQGRATQNIGLHKSAEQLSGIQLNRSAGDAFDMEINMYGVK